MPTIVPDPSDSDKDPRRPPPSILVDNDSRDADDVLTAALFNWFHEIVTVRLLRFIATDLVDQLERQGFVVLPTSALDCVGDQQAGA